MVCLGFLPSTVARVCFCLNEKRFWKSRDVQMCIYNSIYNSWKVYNLSHPTSFHVESTHHCSRHCFAWMETLSHGVTNTLAPKNTGKNALLDGESKTLLTVESKVGFLHVATSPWGISNSIDQDVISEPKLGEWLSLFSCSNCSKIPFPWRIPCSFSMTFLRWCSKDRKTMKRKKIPTPHRL